MNKGFTLIEVIIYIALFSLLIGTAFVTAFQLIDGSGKISIKNTIESEGNFVLRKIDWALTGVDPTQATTPSSGTPSSVTLTLTKYDGNQIDFRLNGTKIEIKESGGIFLPLTTDNVSVSSLQFTYIVSAGGAPAGITATFIMNGITFTITKYIRK